MPKETEFLTPEESLESVRQARERNLTKLTPRNDDARNGAEGQGASRDPSRTYRGAMPGTSVSEVRDLPSIEDEMTNTGVEDENEVDGIITSNVISQDLMDPDDDEIDEDDALEMSDDDSEDDDGEDSRDEESLEIESEDDPARFLEDTESKI